MSRVAGQADTSTPRVSFSPSSGVSNCYVFKSRLQEYAQKVGISTPVYETTKEGPSHQPNFQSTVVVNGIRYDSLTGFQNRKAAEQSAAEVALLELSKSGDINQSIAQPVHETGLCKNLLQEYAQKMNCAVPLYLCHKEEVPGRTPLFKCSVEIGGILYIGASAKTKKEAEIKAARTALLSIQSSSSDCCDIQNSEFVVVPSKRKTLETTKTPLETANVPRSKKARATKRSLKQKVFRDKRRKSKGKVSDNSGDIDGQSRLELDKRPGPVVEGADYGQLAVSATGNFQCENFVTNLNEDVKNILAPNTYDGAECAQPVVIPFAKASGGETKMTGVDMVLSYFDNATPAQAEASNSISGLTPVGKSSEVAASQTSESKTTGVGMVVSLVNNTIPVQVDASNSVSGTTPVGERIEMGTIQITESMATAVATVVSSMDNADPVQVEASSSVCSTTPVGERIEMGTIQTTESMTTAVGTVVSSMDNADTAQTEASNSLPGITPVGDSIEVDSTQG